MKTAREISFFYTQFQIAFTKHRREEENQEVAPNCMIACKFWISVGQEKPGIKGRKCGNERHDREKGEEQIIIKLEGLIDAAIDIGSETVLKTLAKKLNASARV